MKRTSTDVFLEHLGCRVESIGRFLEDYTLSGKAHKAFIKASAVIFFAAISVFASKFVVLLEAEDRAYTHKFNIEEKYSKPLTTINCAELKTGQADCFLAQHRYSTISSFTENLGQLTQLLLMMAGLIFFFGCSFLFFFVLFYRSSANTSLKDE